MTFAENLRAARNAAGLSFSELAARVGVARQAIQLLETGRVKMPRADTAARIAEALGTTVDALMGEKVLFEKRPSTVDIKRAEGIASLVRESPEAYVQAATVLFKLRRGVR